MRSIQEGHMQDECVILHYAPGTDSHNEDVAGYVADESTTICGLDMRPGDERHTPQYTALVYDATVRLPIGTVIDAKDRLSITKRYGETLEEPLGFEIVGPVQQGPSGIRLKLKKVKL
jgi:hypothetical protein